MNTAENEPHEGLVENITEEEFKTLQDEGVLDNTFTYDEYKDLLSEPMLEDELILPAATYKMTKGDIFITSSTSFKGLTGHAGIAINQYQILHFPGPSVSGPKLISRSDWHKRYPKTNVYRVKNSTIRTKAADWAYNNYYNKKITYRVTSHYQYKNPSYCSKIVWQAYYYGTGITKVVNIPPGGIAAPYQLPNYFVPAFKPVRVL